VRSVHLQVAQGQTPVIISQDFVSQMSERAVTPYLMDAVLCLLAGKCLFTFS
jgi:hypothetical protein